MFKRIGIPLIALAAILILISPSQASARGHWSFGVFVGPPIYSYPPSYVYSYPYPYPPYTDYYYTYPYSYSYTYVYPRYRTYYYGGYWRGPRRAHEWREREWRERERFRR